MTTSAFIPSSIQRPAETSRDRPPCVAAPLGGLQLVVEGANQEPGGGAEEEKGRGD